MNPTPATLRAIEWLDERLAELRDIRNATSRDPIFKNWRQGTVTVLQRIWPADAQRVERFRRIPFSPADPRADARAVREAFGRGCQEATRVLKGFVEDLRAHGAPDAPASAPEVGTSDFEDGFPTMDLPAGDVTRSSEPPLLPGDLFGDMGDLPPTLADGSAPPRLQVTVPTPPLAATAPAPSAGADSPAPPAPSASVPVVPPVSEPPVTTPNEVAAAEVPTPSPASDASVVAGAPAKRTNGSRWRLRDLLGFAQLSARTLAGLPAEGADAAVAAVPPAAPATPATPANPTTPAAAATPVTPATPAAPEATAPSAAPTAPETTAPSVAPVASSVPATSDPVVEPAAPVVAEVVPLEAAVPVTPATPVSASSDAAVPAASAVTTPEIASPVVAPSSSEVPVPGTSSSAPAPPSAADASVSPRTVVETPESIVTHTTTLRAPIEKVGMDALVSPELRQAEPVEPTPVAAQAAPDATPNPAAPEVVASTESVAPITEVAAVAQSVAEEVTPTTEVAAVAAVAQSVAEEVTPTAEVAAVAQSVAEEVTPTTEVAAVAQSVAEEVTPTAEVAAVAPPVAEEVTPTTEVAPVAPPVAEAPKPAARSGKRRSRSSNARVTRLDDPEFNVDPTPSASLPRPSSEMPVPHLVPSASRPAPDSTEEPAPPVERTPKHARLEPVSQAPTDDTGTRVDPDEFAIAADDFVRTSPVLGAAGRRVARRADANEFTDPDAIAVASLVDDLGELGVPAGRHAEMRARLLDLARRIEHGTLDWSVLRKAMWFAMEHPELARRVVPVLLPWMDRAA